MAYPILTGLLHPAAVRHGRRMAGMLRMIINISPIFGQFRSWMPKPITASESCRVIRFRMDIRHGGLNQAGD
jgi:hypothetical protein